MDNGEESGGGQFYVNHDGFKAGTYTFTIDSPKTWNECVSLKDDTGVYEITYDEMFPGSGLYRFFITDNKYWYAIETDEDGNTPTPEDLIKIGTTYNAYQS